MVICQTLALPFRSLTNGKLRVPPGRQGKVNQVPHERKGHVEATISDFISYYHYWRYHKVLAKVMSRHSGGRAAAE